MINKVFKLILIVFMTLWIGKNIIYPIGIGVVYSSDYMEYLVKCDQAMESDWYNRQNNLTNKADTIQLLDCHEYDKLRKTLLMSGLPDQYVSWLGLKALELYQRPASEFIELHKFQYR